MNASGGRRGVVGVVVLGAVWLTVPPPAAACPWYNPLCWLEEGVDYFSDLVGDLGDLTWDVVTLDPEGAFDDLVDIGENVVCGQLTVLNLIGGNIAQSMYNNNCAAPHGIAPEILDKLRPYFHSDFTSVVIHEACDFTDRNAVTFGEHIYFQRPDPTTGALGYHPLDAASGTVDPAGFAELAHELVHVLQYRRQGFTDGDGLGDACDSGTECGSGDTMYEDCPAHSWGSGSGCQPIPDGGYEP